MVVGYESVTVFHNKLSQSFSCQNFVSFRSSSTPIQTRGPLYLKIMACVHLVCGYVINQSGGRCYLCIYGIKKRFGILSGDPAYSH